MKFGAVPLAQAEGAILAHAVKAGGVALRKGQTLGKGDIDALKAAGRREVTVAILAGDDLAENQAAEMIGAAGLAAGIIASKPHAGRVNLLADHAGVLEVNATAVNAVNAIDPAITLATLPVFTRVSKGQLLATIKIIPYAVAARAAGVAAAKMSGAFKLHGVAKTKVSLVMSTVDGFKPSLLDKGRRAVETRLARFGLGLTDCQIVPHNVAAMAQAISESKGDLLLLLGASATGDIADTAPEALRQAGGEVRRFGIPVDPGNLLFVGRHNGRNVLGLPGCARSLALNGADWVLERLICGIKVDEAMLAGMGVGGLLKEIPTRPQPRQNAGETKGKVAIILLAAGQSRRMRGRDKLLETVGEGTMIEHAAQMALASKADTVFVALPPEADARKARLAGLAVRPIKAPDYGEGMGGSLRNAMTHIGSEYSAVIVALADMPEVTPAHFDALIKAYNPTNNQEICRAQSEDGTQGHPVLFGRRFFEALADSQGDSGGRAVIRSSKDYVLDVKTDGNGACLDLDTPEAWAAWRGEDAR
ncbi:MAG: NTP transferase domain-containing protein [Rhodobacteraceae bacterium]|nr:NTP transferase domain-containing protein [Paracoccaceae bacterium]